MNTKVNRKRPGKSALAIGFMAWAFFYLFGGVRASFAQKIYATTVSAFSPNTKANVLDFYPYDRPTALNPTNATAENGAYARLLASPGVVLDWGSYSGYVELEYSASVPANTPTYIKVQGNSSLFEALLGGTLGDLLSGVLGTVLGDQRIGVKAFNASNAEVLSGTSQNGLGGDALRMVQAEDGDYYLRVTPAVPYKKVRITNSASALLALGTEFALDVYHAFYYGPQCNYSPQFVAYQGNGINLDALSLGAGGVGSAQDAIDDDLGSTSTISPGLLNVLGSISQQFYFAGTSEWSDDVMVTLSGDPALVNLELFNNVSFQAYDGENLVFDQDLGSLSDELLGFINLDLLGLLGDGEQVTFPVSPGVPFDRFEITVGSLLDVDVGEALNVHDVQRTVGMPSFGISGNSYTACKGSTLTMAPDDFGGTGLRWYDAAAGGNVLGSGEEYVIGNVQDDGVYYVSTVQDCGGEEVASMRVPVSVDALEMPEESDYSAVPSQAAYGPGELVVLHPDLELTAGIEAPEFSWSFDPSGIPVISGEVVLDKGDHTVTYRKRTDGAMEVEGLIPGEPIDELYLVLKNGEAGCEASQRVEQVFVILPVIEMSLKAENQQDKVHLTGTVLLPGSAVGMWLQRAGGQLVWEDMGAITLSEEAGKEGRMDRIDPAPLVGRSFYRLMVELADGRKVYSKVVAVDVEASASNAFGIMPNPAVSVPRLLNQGSGAFKDITVLVVDDHGVVKETFDIARLEPGEASRLEPSSPMRPGVYIYCVSSGGFQQRIKVIW